jgi:ADP-heptose:LPS heptosyltransferase
MTHLAEAVGTDVVTLYGPTSRELGYYPVRPTSRALELPLACRPCTRMGEGACHHPLKKACLVGITPQAVLNHVLSVIAADGATGATGAAATGQTGGGTAAPAQASPTQ